MVLIMVIIFIFSAMAGDESSAASGVFLKALEELWEDVSKHALSDKAMSNLHLIIRKIAHFTEYGALGIAASFGFKGVTEAKRKCLILSVFVSFIYAITDEIHQYFVPGRYGTFTDVLIDTCGAAVFTFIYIFLFNKKRKANEKV